MLLGCDPPVKLWEQHMPWVIGLKPLKIHLHPFKSLWSTLNLLKSLKSLKSLEIFKNPLRSLKIPKNPGAPKWSAGSGKVSTPRFLGAPVNYPLESNNYTRCFFIRNLFIRKLGWRISKNKKRTKKFSRLTQKNLKK